MSPPVPEEWDFGAYKNNFLDEQLDDTAKYGNIYACFVYEYARELPHVLKAFREDRKHNRRIVDGAWRCSLVLPPLPVETFDPNLGTPGSVMETWDELTFFPRLQALRLVAPSGFPETPYLLLDHPPQPDLSLSWLLQRSESVTPVTKDRGMYLSEDGTSYQHDWVTMLHLNWYHSKDAIVESFRSWVQCSGPKEPSSHQGKNVGREIEANLKALGTWRLMRAFAGDIKKATAYCKKSTGRIHIIRNEDWRLISSRADRILKELSRREIRG